MQRSTSHESLHGVDKYAFTEADAGDLPDLCVSDDEAEEEETDEEEQEEVQDEELVQDEEEQDAGQRKVRIYDSRLLPKS